ncbi:MAG: hypothetical protein AVDCRST_MAG66-2500, partial [uncultured Pseudonocardia sp.]
GLVGHPGRAAAAPGLVPRRWGVPHRRRVRVGLTGPARLRPQLRRRDHRRVAGDQRVRRVAPGVRAGRRGARRADRRAARLHDRPDRGGRHVRADGVRRRVLAPARAAARRRHRLHHVHDLGALAAAAALAPGHAGAGVRAVGHRLPARQHHRPARRQRARRDQPAGPVPRLRGRARARRGPLGRAAARERAGARAGAGGRPRGGGRLPAGAAPPGLPGGPHGQFRRRMGGVRGAHRPRAAGRRRGAGAARGVVGRRARLVRRRQRPHPHDRGPDHRPDRPPPPAAGRAGRGGGGHRAARRGDRAVGVPRGQPRRGARQRAGEPAAAGVGRRRRRLRPRWHGAGRVPDGLGHRCDPRSPAGGAPGRDARVRGGVRGHRRRPRARARRVDLRAGDAAVPSTRYADADQSPHHV